MVTWGLLGNYLEVTLGLLKGYLGFFWGLLGGSLGVTWGVTWVLMGSYLGVISGFLWGDFSKNFLDNLILFCNCYFFWVKCSENFRIFCGKMHTCIHTAPHPHYQQVVGMG